MASNGNEPLAATLMRAIEASLQGDQQAMAFLEALATPDLGAGSEQLLAVWEAALQVLAANSPSPRGQLQSPKPYFAACILSRNVRQQWPLLPAPTRAQLAQGTWDALTAYVRRAPPGADGLACVGVDPAVHQVVAVVVAQAVGVDALSPEEAHAAARALLTRALQSQPPQQPPGQDPPIIGACLLLLSLRALTGLAEEAKEGFGGRLGDSVLPEAGPQVCELALRGLVEAAAPANSAAFYSPADRAVLLEVCAQTFTGWAAYGGVTWAALVAVGGALERALEALAGAEPRAIAKVAAALEDMAEVAARAWMSEEGVDEGMGVGVGDGQDEAEEARQRDEGLARLIGAYLRLFGLAQGDTDALHHAVRAVAHFLRQPRVRRWVMLGGRAEASAPVNAQHHALVLQALGILLEGADCPHRPTSATCLEVWVDLHKVPFAGRAPDLAAPLYERLLEVALRRAQYPAGSQPSHDTTDEDDEEDEDGNDGEGRVRWGEYREQTLYEVLYRCQEVLRSRYVAALEARLQPAVAAFVGGGGGGGQWQPLEALVFALRAVGLDLARRALLRQAAPQALQNTARIARRALGLEEEIPLEELRAEAERTHTLLLAVLRPLLALPASSSQPLPPGLWVALVRCLQPMAQLLGKAQDPTLVQQAMALLTQSLSIPASCPYTVEAVRTLASRCAPSLQDPSATAIITPLLPTLHATPLTGDEAATLAAAILPLLSPSTTPLEALATPVLQRLTDAADALPDAHFAGGRSRLLADVAIASTLLRRLPSTHALDFLSHAWPPLCALTTRSAVLPTPPTTNGGGNGERGQQPSALLLAAGLLDAMTRAATLPLSVRAEARNRGGREGDAGAVRVGEGVVAAVVQAMQEGRLSTRAPEAFIHAVGQLIEAWGPIVERGLGMPGEAAAIALLLDAVGEAVTQAVQREEVGVMEAAVQTWSSCLDMCPGATMGRPAFQRELEATAAWAASAQTHEFAQSAMVLLTSFLELPARLRLDDEDAQDGGGGDGGASASAEWRRGMLASWQGALGPIVPSLAISLLLGLLGSAPETTLDALCQLLRALLLRFPDGVLGLLQPFVAAATSPPSDAAAAALAQALPTGVPPETAQALVQQLRAHPGLQSRLLLLLRKAAGRGGSAGSKGSVTGAWMDLSLFRDLGCDVWAFCQGTKGADCLDRYL